MAIFESCFESSPFLIEIFKTKVTNIRFLTLMCLFSLSPGILFCHLGEVIDLYADGACSHQTLILKELQLASDKVAFAL